MQHSSTSSPSIEDFRRAIARFQHEYHLHQRWEMVIHHPSVEADRSRRRVVPNTVVLPRKSPAPPALHRRALSNNKLTPLPNVFRGEKGACSGCRCAKQLPKSPTVAPARRGRFFPWNLEKTPGVRHLGPPVATVITLVCLATFWRGLLSKRKGQSTFFRQKHQEECIWPSCEASRSTLSVPRHSNSVLTSRCQSVRHLGRGAYIRTCALLHLPRVHKNKSMQHHTLGSGTAEFQVTWPPKLREGTYLVKNVRARFEYRKTIAAHEKQVIMREKAQPCASLWRKTLRPKRVRFLAIDAPIVDYVCLPLYHLTFLGSYQPLSEFSWRKKKEKSAIKGFRFHR